MPDRRGYFDANPTFSMYLSGMDTFGTVQFLIESATCDTTMLIRDASGTVYFNDDFNWPTTGRSLLQLTDTANLRSPHYHQASDTLETLDIPVMANLTLGLFASLCQM